MKRREETELALKRAALDLLERDGVLAGLNLRELADAAGVNRGLVYHYFGSRQEILRTALRQDFERRMKEVRSGGRLRFRERWAHLLRTLIRHRRAIGIATLLHLDRDPSVRMMPIRDETRALLERDQRAGVLPEGIDLDALHVALSSMAFGYSLFRGRFAKETGRSVRDLDRAVEAVLAELLDRLASAPADPAADPPTEGAPEPEGSPDA